MISLSTISDAEVIYNNQPKAKCSKRRKDSSSIAGTQPGVSTSRDWRNKKVCIAFTL